jgi:hypothetical protein
MAKNQQKFTKTPFSEQARIVSVVAREGIGISDEDKVSLSETVGVLTWLNQLQLSWSPEGKGIPENISKQLFEGRSPVKVTAPKKD